MTDVNDFISKLDPIEIASTLAEKALDTVKGDLGSAAVGFLEDALGLSSGESDANALKFISEVAKQIEQSLSDIETEISWVTKDLEGFAAFGYISRESNKAVKYLSENDTSGLGGLYTDVVGENTSTGMTDYLDQTYALMKGEQFVHKQTNLPKAFVQKLVEHLQTNNQSKFASPAIYEVARKYMGKLMSLQIQGAMLYFQAVSAEIGSGILTEESGEDDIKDAFGQLQKNLSSQSQNLEDAMPALLPAMAANTTALGCRINNTIAAAGTVLTYQPATSALAASIVLEQQYSGTTWSSDQTVYFWTDGGETRLYLKPEQANGADQYISCASGGARAQVGGTEPGDTAVQFRIIPGSADKNASYKLLAWHTGQYLCATSDGWILGNSNSGTDGTDWTITPA